MSMHDGYCGYGKTFQSAVDFLGFEYYFKKLGLLRSPGRSPDGRDQFIFRTQINTGAKRFPVSAKDDHPGLLVLFRKPYGLVKVLPQGGIHGVALIGSVQGDKTDMAFPVIGDKGDIFRFFIIHETTPFLVEDGRDGI
jgi:hypothetical protein